MKSGMTDSEIAKAVYNRAYVPPAQNLERSIAGTVCRPVVSIAVTPLIDLLFILLIFFLISSSVVFHPGMTVNLPETIDDAFEIGHKYVVTATRETTEQGQRLVYFNDQRVDGYDGLERQLGELAEELRRRQALSEQARATPIVIVKADAEVSYPEVVRIISTARKHGMTVFLATEKGALQ